ncbi:MAG: PEP-CTERM sorting domain-containing protein [Planctomycetes bacterium]|nr:PEP-CTERM sorting domain-containing protein [Planctomycetota bacterium]
MSLRIISRVFILGVVVVPSLALAVGPEVIYSEVAASPTGVVPGAKDAAGNPVVTNWLALEDLSMRHDGGEWMLKGRTTQATTLDSILVKGGGGVGSAFAQDGQPLLGGVAGEQYDFFDTPIPASWDSAGNIGFSCRAKGGVSTRAEKIIRVVGGVHTVILQQDDPALGLIDFGAPSGDERFGNSMNSVQLLNSGVASFVNTPITNMHSSRYPAMFRGNTSFKQSGVSTIAGEVWDNFVLEGAGGTPDGLHWFAEGDTEIADTTKDGIFVVDDVVVMRENNQVAGAGTPLMADVFFGRMLDNADWYARGDDPADNDWAVRNGTLMAKTGDVFAGAEAWGVSFLAFTGDHAGNWLLAGSTNNADPSLDEVLVYNGSTVLLRESDPIDLNANGLFDDNVFLRSIQPNDVHLTDSGEVYMLVTLKDGAGTNLGDGFLKLNVPEPATLTLIGAAVFGFSRRRKSAR